MTTIKLALTTMGVCALLGVSTDAHAKLNLNLSGGRSSLVGAVKERLSHLATHVSSAPKPAQKPAAQLAQRDNSAKATTPGALAKTQAKLSSLTKQVSSRLSPNGTMRGAKSRASDRETGLVMMGASLPIFGFLVTVPMSVALNNPMPAFANAAVAAGGAIAGFAWLAHYDGVPDCYR